MSDRIKARDVAQITGLSLRTVQQLAAAGSLPGAAQLGGKMWTFDPAKVRAWVRQQELKACRAATTDTYTSAAKLGGDVSALPDESIEAAYAHLIKGKPKSALRRGA